MSEKCRKVQAVTKKFINRSFLREYNMAIERTHSLRKASGGRIKPNRKSRQYAKVNRPILTKIGEDKRKNVRSAGNNPKTKLINAKTIAVALPKENKIEVVEIQSVLENQANKNYVQRDIFNKGALVKTKLGNVRITSRPGQTGTLSGILVT